ncbi:hypothetical protein NL676_002823 [Syzygium grande]|nr:hypothetical protein NL676_002823 [Syzygium grande]
MNKRIASLQNQVDELRATMAYLVKQKYRDDMDASSSIGNFDSKEKDKMVLEWSSFPEVAEFDTAMERLVTYLEGRISDLEGSPHKTKEGEEPKHT